jgi:hypothetical protein
VANMKTIVRAEVGSADAGRICSIEVHPRSEKTLGLRLIARQPRSSGIIALVFSAIAVVFATFSASQPAAAAAYTLTCT